MIHPRTHDPAVIEHRLLDLAYTSDAVITAPLLAYYAPCAIEDAEHVLDRLVTEDRLRLEVDDEGNVSYVVPNRQHIAAPHALVAAPVTAMAATREPHAGVAALLSLVVPGAGQLYVGRPVSALSWFVVVTLGYLLIVPGIMLHILCVAAAATAAHQVRTATA